VAFDPSGTKSYTADLLATSTGSTNEVPLSGNGGIIKQPSSGANYQVTSAGMEGSVSTSVPFQAIAASGDSVNWSTKTQYSTSGGVPAAASTASFKTANDATQYNTYSGIGGQMTIGATSGPYSDSVTITLSGTYIDASPHWPVITPVRW